MAWRLTNRITHGLIFTQYRDCTAVSKVDGSRSLVYNVPWTMMFTDDKGSYLEWCKAKTLELVKQGKIELPAPRPPP